MGENKEKAVQLLKEIPLFAGLESSELERLADSFSLLSFEAGQMLYQPSWPSDGLYLVSQGRVAIIGEDPSTMQWAARHGDILGEEVLQGLPARMNSATAITDCELFFIDNSKLGAAFQRYPEILRTRAVLLKSQALGLKIPMPWMQADEEINLITRKHPIFLFLNSIVPILGFAAVLVATLMLGPASPSGQMTVIIAAFVITSLWLAWNIHNWANDFYLITNKRLVWVERISGLYDSRQEAPLGTLVSVGTKRSQLGALLGFADVIVRTYIGDIRFNRVADASEIGKLIEVYWNKTKKLDLETDAREIRAAMRQVFGDTLAMKTQKSPKVLGSMEKTVLPGRETRFFEWLFSDFLKLRYEVGGTTTYRKHWFVLMSKAFLPVVLLLGSIAFSIAVVTKNLSQLDYRSALTFGIIFVCMALFWVVYVYVDWRNDVFQLTPNQVIDIDRKPFGLESRRSAPLENILSIEYERRGIMPMAFNYGTVFITIGNTQLTFNDVYQPSQVQQDIFTRMGVHMEEKLQRANVEERERIAQWFKVYHEETKAKDITDILRIPED